MAGSRSRIATSTASYAVSDTRAGPEVSTYGRVGSVGRAGSVGRNVRTTDPASAPRSGHLPSVTLIPATPGPRTAAFVTPKSHTHPSAAGSV
ncbi:hypothetical protein GCM10010358_67410 [Streptomyces minutiscleroticus]|uniref:Uncharacterized protein n=1 Tax=Streptomyces minutiscleroticus TaxID=68238 RepID=A0A918NXV8_9ACTN|nr:hypothetical protein GCM10010358_67410 [Streptomyces minutiscleroticus]